MTLTITLVHSWGREGGEHTGRMVRTRRPTDGPGDHPIDIFIAGEHVGDTEAFDEVFLSNVQEAYGDLCRSEDGERT